MRHKIDMELIIGQTLRFGVIISILLIVVGVVILFIQGQSNGISLDKLSMINSTVNSSSINVNQMLLNFSFNGLNFIILGLLTLIATPIARIILGIASFAMEKDKLYVIITVIVLFNLIFSIFILPAIIHI
jgi:Predicted membrane protein